MEQIVAALIEKGGLIGVALAAVGFWGYNESKHKNSIQEKRIEDTKLFVESTNKNIVVIEKLSDALDNLRHSLDRRNG